MDPDFLDRISPLTLQLPPIREVREEIVWLWDETYDRASRRAGISGRQGKLGEKLHKKIVDTLERHQLPGNLRDLFRVAYRILGARSDPHEPLSGDEAVEYGLKCLDDRMGTSTHAGGVSKMVARAFVESAPLDDIIDAESRIPTRMIDRDLKAYLASEIRRVGKKRGMQVDQLCDVTDRTLRTWLSTDSSVHGISG